MPATLNDVSTNVDHEYANEDSQATFVQDLAARIRVRANANGIQQMALADQVGIKRSSMTNYWNGKRAYPLEALPRLAERLNTSVDYLVSGRSSPNTRLVDALDADWIEVPQYDLRLLADDSFGEIVLKVPMRRDWLFAKLRVTNGLWLARLPSEYRPANLEEGSMVICRTVERAELAEGHICFWRYDHSVVIGRYSIVPDAMRAQGMSGTAPPGFASSELIISPSQLGGGENRYHLVGRILGSFLRPL